MSNKLDSMNATGEASGNLLLNVKDTTFDISNKIWVSGQGWIDKDIPDLQDGYPHHIDFQKQYEHDQETMRLMSDEINRLRKIIANIKD